MKNPRTSLVGSRLWRDMAGPLFQAGYATAAGWYETGLPWKGNHPPLPSNKQGIVRRLDSLMRKLNRSSITEKYDQIIQEQIQENIVENAPGQPNGCDFYIPHKPVIRENADSTKLRIVYDASAKGSPDAPWLNDCLHAGPSLQNKLWSVLAVVDFTR